MLGGMQPHEYFSTQKWLLLGLTSLFPALQLYPCKHSILFIKFIRSDCLSCAPICSISSTSLSDKSSEEELHSELPGATYQLKQAGQAVLHDVTT